MPRKKVVKKIKLDAYQHKGEKRINNPPVGLVSSETDKLDGVSKYQHDPHIDPFLSWTGKKEGSEIDVQNVSLHIHERIDPSRLTKVFLKKDEGPKQVSLFEESDNEPPLHKAIDFYKHEQDWTNRLIAGDSLLVMNSLLNKEGMAGKVQMVYIDPPYGIKYNSNFQPFTNRRDVKEADEGLPIEPEMIQAFRDTWQFGTHSYLTHLRNRILLSRDLLHVSGSIFVQISAENLHHVREVLDELFGVKNFVTIITFTKTRPLGAVGMPEIVDYIIWYARDKEKMKFHQLFTQKDLKLNKNYYYVELPDGSRRKLTSDEKKDNSLLPNGSRLFQYEKLASSGYTKTCYFPIDFENKTFLPKKQSWRTNKKGIEKLREAKRLFVIDKNIYYLSYFNDFPVQPLPNLWVDTRGEMDMRYIVQTTRKVVQRCLLMVTDPGDLVIDPTCGSGTTAIVAEQWGRRWITCDTSRVAITLARQRLTTSVLDYYKLAHKEEGVRSGFEYKTSPHISLGTITGATPPKDEVLYDKPKIDKSIKRVCGPFTVEAVPSLRVRPVNGKDPEIQGSNKELSQTGETGNQSLWRDELQSTGIRSTGGKIIEFSRIEPMSGTRFLHAEGEILDKSGKNKVVYVSFGPDFGPIEQRQIEESIKEAKALKRNPDIIVFAAFHFDPEAAKDIDQIEWPGVSIIKAQMSVDLLTKDLRKKRSSSQSYWLIGQPDIEIIKDKKNNYKVKVLGFDYYDPVTGEIVSKDSKHIAMWFLDTDYDERSLLPEQVFFPEGNKKRDWTILAKALNGEVDEDLLEVFSGTESLLFKAGKENKIAVKIIDNRGIESLVIKDLQ